MEGLGTHQRSFKPYHPRLPMASLPRDWGLQLSYTLLSQEHAKLYGLQIWRIHLQGQSE